MIGKLSSLMRALREAANAVVRGDFFGSSLQNQLVTLEALQETLRGLSDLKQQNEALKQQNEALALRAGEIAVATNATLAIWGLGKEDQNEPEEAVIRFIMPFLTDKTAIDVGAHKGCFTKELLGMGFSAVWSVEPHPHLAEKLTQTYLDDSRVSVLALALASENSDAALHLVSRSRDATDSTDPLLFSALTPHNMPCGLEFTGETVAVQARTISSLVKEGRLPNKAGLLKVDAEGYDLAVFKGMNSMSGYEILMSEFWSPDFVFATPGIPDHEAVCKYLAGTGYPFSISIVRRADRSLCWTANMPVALRQTWGNTLFFRDAALFQAAISFVSKFIPGPALSDAPAKS